MSNASNAGAAACLSGGGEMGALMRATDWSKTPIGPVESWSPTLRTMVSFLLANRFPLLLWWGPQYISIYNDAYRPILGTKHPGSMGQPVRECWSEIWHILKPLIDTPFSGGPATWMEDLELEIQRSGFFEETHFTVAYSPVPDETAPRGIGGVLATVHEITEKVIGERRVAVLRDLGARVAQAKTAEEACAIAAAVLANHPKDVPFALLYLIDPDAEQARLAGIAGVAPGEAAAPPAVSLDTAASEGAWPFGEVVRREELVVAEDLAACLGRVPAGPWSDPPRSALVVPVRSNKVHQLAGLLVAGVSPRLRLDDLYRSFLELVASQIATGVANARAYEEERKRAEALAEIDRAKTAFFSNVSHEFRTPLTLMLGPLEGALAAPAETLPQRREDLALVHRNSLRLLRLVNTLLDFSRIEAGRVEASFAPADLPGHTAELAGMFRAAIEQAGLRLTVDCPALEEPVWVDRDMWEKIVLNLLSNAFKFTFEGEIAVRVRQQDNSAVLTVRDTGTGIPEHEIPRLFDRFHRVEGARGRTHEGTGIGLALVQELVRLHGGEVRAESALGQGSTFTVTIPLGTAHLPADRLQGVRSLVSTALGAQPYVAEALRWLPGDDGGKADPGIEQPLLPVEPLPTPCGAQDEHATILFADDNADMRDYVRHLLSSRYRVLTVANGVEALAELRGERRPDLLLSDIMMPQMDGLELLRAVRGDPGLTELPVIFLSARAGEEASVEGLEAGADDYLIKPFSATELLARVAANLNMARIRRGSDLALREAYRETAEILESIGDAFFAVDNDWRLTYVNQRAEKLWAKRRDELLRQNIWEAFPEVVGTPIHDAMQQVMRERAATSCEAQSGVTGGWLRCAIYPSRTGVSAYLRDFTKQKRAQTNLLEQRRILEMVAAGTPLNKVLDELMLLIESQEPGMTCGLLLTEDRVNFLPGSGPNIPLAYKQALHEAIKTAPITPPYFATCAEAAHCGRIVLVSDVARDEKYAQPWRDLMLASGLQAVRSTPVRASDGRVIGCLALYFSNPCDPNPANPELIDIATHLAAIAIERHQTDEALRNLNLTLEERIRERTQALEAEMAERQKVEAMLQQVQRLEAIGQLTGGVAHDFNNLLTVILANIDMLKAKLGEAEDTPRFIAAVQRAAERGAQLTNQLLAFSRRQQLQPQTVSLRPLLVAIGELVRRAVGEAISLELRPDAQLWPSHLDPAQFESAILNLAINARDAMPEGGRLIIASSNLTVGPIEAGRLDLSPGDYVRVTVTDDGAGMSPEVQRRAFEPFFTTKDIGKGTGLGLAQTYGFARQSGGTAAIDSVVGKGTTVALYLPRATGEVIEEPPAETKETTRGRGKTILVVEDQADVLEVIEMFLDGLDYRIMTATDGVAARKLLESGEAIDLLLTDVVMPNGVSGIELARDARRLRQDLRIVMMSGYVRDAERRAGALRDVVFLEKPFRQTELANIISAALAASRE